MFCTNILVAYDGSELSDKALQKAMQIVEMNPVVSLEVLVVIKFTTFVGSIYAPGYDKVIESDLQYCSELVAKADNALSNMKTRHSVSLVQGLPEEEILNFAKEHGSDLIIMGSRGLTGLKEMFMGSVSHYVVQHAEIPVLIVK
jgi:nucleotide-binding universal stress UspA family protein